MPNTYSQLYVQIVFAVKGRENLIQLSWEDELYKYITGIIQNKGQKLLAINGMPNHIHILIGFKPDCNISDLVREIKKSSHSFINEKKFCKSKFYWQEGFGAFSYNHSMLNRIISYINNQKKHHKTKTFREEYLEILQKFNVEFNQAYLFEFNE
ncbi:IS200/IS605 family transposase [Polaribacter sp. BAL334]|uniref:IS200/IS605 family transposase n=1 Tax=Polaribacter sp. BAL334 TaxID=1708178 RepID=UPI0018D213A7|nr:IS200/IS605 family transposase [Polaribacter sp. BAL334]MBG7611341.1 IS200/IS605 family transposase [Polaribacter sp. BAL334]